MLSNSLKTVKVMVLAAAVSLVSAGAAYAATQEPPEGGVWDYGTAWLSGMAWSYYTHPSKGHGSSVRIGGLNPGVVRSVCARAGVQSKAEKWRHPGASADYYYRIDSTC